MELDEQERSSYIAGLRRLADVLERNPQLEAPYIGGVMLRVDDLTTLQTNVRTYGGKWEKESTESDYHVSSELGAGVKLILYAQHEKVCQRVVVGKKLVPEQIIPAQEAQIVPAHEEEEVRWDCPAVLTRQS